MKFAFAALSGAPDAPAPDAAALVCCVYAERAPGPTAAALDAATGGALTRAMEAGKFSGKAEETLTLLAPAGLPATRRMVLLGLGKAGEITALTAQKAGSAIVAALEKTGDAEVQVVLDDMPDAALSAATLAAEMAFGGRLRSYRFDKYRTQEKPDSKPTLKKLVFRCAAPDAAQAALAARDPVSDAVLFARDLVSEPANAIYPESLAERCKALEELGVKLEVLEPKKLRKLGMGALLGVAQGSDHEARVVVMRYDGAPDDARGPVALVGKGVTFDSGGISIKPSGGMEDMKWDMAGSAVVIGAMHALAGRKAKVNAVGIVGLVENMPSGTAQRPGDVVKSLSGQTIEVINTDAEGRLVLCDCMTYVQDHYKPRLMVDVATLTGAIIVSLGREFAGLFCNDDGLAAGLTAAGAAVGEPLWRLPLGEAYDKDINSDIADMKNIGTPGVGGSITAAQFLKRFVKDDRPWAHLDIAGVAWSKKDAPVTPKGATAFGVRLLDRFIADSQEG